VFLTSSHTSGQMAESKFAGSTCRTETSQESRTDLSPRLISGPRIRPTWRRLKFVETACCFDIQESMDGRAFIILGTAGAESTCSGVAIHQIRVLRKTKRFWGSEDFQY